MVHQIVSNDEYKSVQHRVLANSYKESRISIAMFFNLTKWKDDGYYGPLPELLSSEKLAIYRDFTKDEVIETFASRALGNKRLVERFKIWRYQLDYSSMVVNYFSIDITFYICALSLLLYRIVFSWIIY